MLSKIPSFTAINTTWYFQLKFRIATWFAQHLVTRVSPLDLVPPKLLLYFKHDLNLTSLCQVWWRGSFWCPLVKQFLFSLVPRSLLLEFLLRLFCPPFTLPYLLPLWLIVLYFELNLSCHGVGVGGQKSQRPKIPGREEINLSEESGAILSPHPRFPHLSFLPWNLRSFHFSPFTSLDFL